ncbi:hypothetical protein SCUCBS95973_001195 [Sporothrix curviconia]|uniref:Zn(2)-C6 fungal-type domain-containing protein n=1 Tax=Sporothrix curviconia TaxID=1260050 RepID=A0ABP0AWL8_9PEZI
MPTTDTQNALAALNAVNVLNAPRTPWTLSELSTPAAASTLGAVAEMPASTPASKDNEPRYTRGRKSRGRGLRKTTGCLTCRRRHVSCDEAKPVCGGCQRTMRTCEYRSQATPTKSTSNGNSNTKAAKATAPSVTASSSTATSRSSSRRRGDANAAGISGELPELPALREDAVVVVTGIDNDAADETQDETQDNAGMTDALQQQLDDSVGTMHGPPSDVPCQQPPTPSLHTSAPGFTLLAAAATAVGPPPSLPPQTTPQQQTISTPSTTYSLQLSPGQARHKGAAYAPSVSSGRVSLSQQELFGAAGAGSLMSYVPNVEAATAQWLGLLIGDAAQDAGGGLATFDWDCEAGGVDCFGNTAAADMAAVPAMATMAAAADEVGPALSTMSTLPSGMTSTGAGNIYRTNPGLQERFARFGGEQQLEVQAWHHAPLIELAAHEHVLFQHFVRNISRTMDLFDLKKSFGTFVPHLAMHNVGLINAILALSSRHLSLKARADTATSPEPQPPPPNENEAIRYYYKTLHYIQKAMEYDTYKTSLELLATSIIVSTYEMLDGSRRDWERHLQGVFLIQRSQVIHGDSGGLRQAVWWSWLCQDVWAAFRERRKPLTFWQPKKRLEELDPHELAARSVLYFAHVVAFCSAEEMERHRGAPAARMAKADALLESLEDWRHHHTVEFDPLPSAAPVAASETTTATDTAFQPIWIHPPAFGVAMQLYYCARILLALHRPLVGDLDAYLQQRKAIQRYVAIVCGIALTLTDDAASVMCSQCLYIAGLSIEDPTRQRAVLGLLEECRQRAVWPATPLGDELARKWQASQ